MSVYGAHFDGTAWPWTVEGASEGWLSIHDATGRYVSDACVEGDAEDFAALAVALRSGVNYHAKRCAARRDGDAYELYSPRNSTGGAAMLPASRAADLAEIIERALAEAA